MIMQQENGSGATRYIFTIYKLRMKYNYVRRVDVARELNVTMSSVTHMFKTLASDGSVLVAEDGDVTLSQECNNIARQIYEKYIYIKSMLINRGVDAKTAACDAEGIAYNLSDESFSALFV